MSKLGAAHRARDADCIEFGAHFLGHYERAVAFGIPFLFSRAGGIQRRPCAPHGIPTCAGMTPFEVRAHHFIGIRRADLDTSDESSYHGVRQDA
jgi:hypothetical protein